MSDSLLDGVIGLFASSAVLAFRLAAPMFVTMLVVDVAIGALSKTMPQLNVLTAGLAIRVLVGLIVVIAGAFLMTSVLQESLLGSMDAVRSLYGSPGR
jgi:flagellar biosynthesis protein FliR